MLQLAAGISLGIGASCLGSQVFRSQPSPALVLLGLVLIIGALLPLSDATEPEER